MANFLIKLRGRPQKWQRLCLRTLNFGVRLEEAILLFLAIAPRQVAAGDAGGD
jgi:hypothetical protein